MFSWDGIVKVNLPQTVFQQNSLHPAKINLILGRNGTGKSVFTKQLQNAEQIMFQEKQFPSEYQFMIFDQDFVSDTVRQHQKLPGIVVFKERNLKTENLLFELTNKKVQLKLEYPYYKAGLAQMDKLYALNLTVFQECCWERTEALRARFENALGNRNAKETLAEAVLAAAPCSHDIEAIESLYRTVFGEETLPQPYMQSVPDPLMIDRFIDDPLLKSPVIGSSDSVFSRFIENIRAMEWVHQGHKQFGAHTGGLCPYCQQTLPSDFEQRLSSCVNADYEVSVQALQALLSEYRQTANDHFLPLFNNLKLADNSMDLHRYRSYLKLLRERIKSNIDQIEIKIQSPSKPVALEPVSDLLSAIQTEINVFNDAVYEKNQLLYHLQDSQNQCTCQIISYFAFLLQSEIAEYQRNLAVIDSIRIPLAEKTELTKMHFSSLQSSIDILTKGITETDTPMNLINRTLSEAGLSHFRLRKCERPDRYYEPVREDGTAAVLSEGEQRFLAFLYFYHSVLTDVSISKPIIAVIDDPFTGMDPDLCGTVVRLIQEMLEHFAAESDRTVQLFFLTCQEDYFREILKNPVCDLFEETAVYRFRRDGFLNTIEPFVW